MTNVLGLAGGLTSAAADPLDCTEPVHLGESAKALTARYGKDAKLEDYVDDGGSGTAVVLFAADPVRTAIVKFGYDTLDHAERVEVYDRATGWLARGVHVGSTLADVEAANGAPFAIEPWGSDIGGYANFGTGKLGMGPGPCRLAVRFDFPQGFRTPVDFEDDRRDELASNDPKLRASAPTVVAIIVSLAEAPVAPVKPSPSPRRRRPAH